MACEEACRLILEEPDYASTVEVEEIDGTPLSFGQFDPLYHRKKVYAILSDDTLPYCKRLHKISRVYGVSPRRYVRNLWWELFSSLEYMDEEHRAWSFCYTSSPNLPRETEVLLERTLAYFIRRHCAEAENVREWNASLGLCLTMARLLASVAAAQNAFDLAAFSNLARAFSEELEYSEENTAAIRELFFPHCNRLRCKGRDSGDFS
jgi:hypothetical protein